jgi:phosphate:Na+ symporter
MPLNLILEALGGLGLFILGMKTLSEGLQRLAGERVRRSLEKLTGNRLTAAFMGSCLTSLLQSSGAASIIIIGFVNAGLLSLYQALAMLIGTGLGTTFVVQFIAFKISFLAAPGIFIGAFLKFFSKRRRWVNLGEVLLGMGLLFFGLQVMETNFIPLKESAIFNSYHTILNSWNLYGVLLGALLAFFVQSGSAAIGLIIALTGSGLLAFEPAVAMVVGEVLGTSVLAAIGAVNGTTAAKRTVLFNLGIAVFSVTIVLLLFPFFIKLVLLFSPKAVGQVLNATAVGPAGHALVPVASLPRALANAHTIFSVLAAMFFLPLIGFFARSAATILPGHGKEDDTEPRLKYIDYRIIDTPSIAFLQARNEARRMMLVAQGMFYEAINLFEDFNSRKFLRIKQKENVMDALQKDISHFLVTLNRQPLTPEISAGISSMLKVVSDLEEIGDNSEKIIDCLRRKKESRVIFSDSAMAELSEIGNMTIELLDLSVNAFANPADSIVDDARLLQTAISNMHEQLKNNHIQRLSNGACTVLAGLLYIDIIAAVDSIAELTLEIVETERGIH